MRINGNIWSIILQLNRKLDPSHLHNGPKFYMTISVSSRDKPGPLFNLCLFRSDRRILWVNRSPPFSQFAHHASVTSHTPMKGFTLTNCCQERIHTACLASYGTCHICQHDNHALAKYSSIGFAVDISIQSILRERKYAFWQPTCVYQFSTGEPWNIPNSCWTYDQSHPHWHVYPHFTQN